jgi:hypothetical protein
VQAKASDHSTVDDIYRVNLGGDDGNMISLRSLVEVHTVIGLQALIRGNTALW